MSKGLEETDDCGCKEERLDDCLSRIEFKVRKSRPSGKSEAQRYLDDRRLGEFFGFLAAHLVAARPDDPADYLYQLLDKCLLYRDGLVDPPLLFAPRHLESLYRSLDPEDVGFISLKQYAAGMKSLGIECYDPKPTSCDCDSVTKEVFLREARKLLEGKLKAMIREPRIC